MAEAFESYNQLLFIYSLFYVVQTRSGPRILYNILVNPTTFNVIASDKWFLFLVFLPPVCVSKDGTIL